jgi:Fe-S-cluster containining protein
VHATWPEAQVLAATLTGEQRTRLGAHVMRLRQEGEGDVDLLAYLRRHRDSLNGCPFLDAEGACGVYAVRPLSCRALHSTRPGDWCGIDLSSLPAIEKELYLQSLDPQWVDFPTHFLSRPRAAAQQLEETLQAAMHKQYGFCVAGNLTVLVWLECELGLSARLANGRHAVESLLETLQLGAWLVRVVAD